MVTNDGIVVDGNRRFTCLKQLYAETKEDKYFYFLASVLDGKLNKKEIKKPELNLQHAEEEKVKYNTIDLLVGIYNEVCKEKNFTMEEYQKLVGIKKSDMKKNMRKI